MAKKRNTSISTKKASPSKPSKRANDESQALASLELAELGDTVDVDIRTESDRYFILDGWHGLPQSDPRMQSSRRLVESGLQIGLYFEGGGMLARFRLGAADSQEEASWFARVHGWLDLTSGCLSYGSSSGPPIRVPPGLYHVEISCLTHSWGHHLLGKAFGERIQTCIEQAKLDSQSTVEVVIRLDKLSGKRPVLRLDRSGCAKEDNWLVRIPIPPGIPLAPRVYRADCELDGD